MPKEKRNKISLLGRKPERAAKAIKSVPVERKPEKAVHAKIRDTKKGNKTR
jgi:hypothetical protein